MRSRGALGWLMVLVGAALALCLRPAPEIVDRPLVEDAYYSLSVARNVALGHGLTIDGVQPTNGFQPLFTLLCVLPQWLAHGDRVLAVRLTLLLCWAIFVASGLLFAAILRRLSSSSTAYVAGGATYLGSMYLLWQHHSGLETGLLLFVYLACWWLFLRCDLARASQAAGLGALLGLLVLTRIDAVFFVAALSLAIVRRRHLRSALVVLGVSALLSAPWWLYCFLEFGSLMPSSGASQQLLGLSMAKLGSALHGLAVCSLPSLYLFGEASAGKTLLSLLLFALICWLFARAVRRDAFNWQEPGQSRDACERSRWFLGAVLLSTLALVVWYTSTSGATAFYRRYFVSLSLVGVTLTALVVDSLAQGSRYGTVALIGSGAPSVALIAFLQLAPGRRPANPFIEQLELVARHVPAGDVVGAFQSGTLGYFRERVVNLDGKVNPEALRNRGRMPEYLDQAQIDWLCDWPSMIERFLAAPQPRGFELVASGPSMVLYRRASKNAGR